MAKRKVKLRQIGVRTHRSPSRRGSISYSIHTVAGTVTAAGVAVTPRRFQACVRIAKRSDTVCRDGKNPRVALGNALKAAGQEVKRRKGAFAGTSKCVRK